MAQIIKHRRGSLESLASITASLQKGEIVIASGSSNLTVSNGSSLVFAAAENGVLQPVNRILVGNGAPNNFAASTYNGLLNGVPYYDSNSGSLYILGSDTNTKLDLLGNINGFSQSVDSRLDSIETSLGGGATGIGTRVAALEVFSASQETKDATLAQFSSSVNTFTASQETKDSTLALYTASMNTFTASQEAKDSTLALYTASMNTFTASQETKDATLALYTASMNTFTASQEAKDSALASYTGSNDSAQSAQNARLSTIESFTGSYATTGSNLFYGNQVITGSVYIAYDLIVQGSSSLQHITASSVEIGANVIELSTATPAVRFGGITVYDSGSTGATGSLFWDSLRDHWVSVRPSSSTEVANSAVLIYGPVNTGSLGDESLLTAGKIPVAQGEDHIGDSIMTQTTGKITVAGNLDVTGEVSSSTIAGLGNATVFSQSVDSRLDTIETSLGGGGSIGARVSALEVFSSSQETKDATLAQFSSSVNTFTASQETKDATLGLYTASMNTFTASQETKDATLALYTASMNTFTASQETKDATLSLYTASMNTFTASQESKDATLALYTASMNTFTASQESKDSTLASYTASVNQHITAINAFSASQESKDATLATYTASVDSRLNQLSSDSGSQNSRLNSLEAFSASQESKDATLATYTASVDNRLNLLSSDSASQAGRLNNLESTSASVNVSLAELNSYSQSLKDAITVSGTAVTIAGNLTVNGTTTTVNSTTVQLGDNIIELNGTGAANGGIYVKDPTAPNTATGSLIWDSTNDYWKAGIKDSEVKILRAEGDSVVSGSSQITLQSTTGFTSFDSALSTITGSLISSASNHAGRLTTLEGTGTIQGVGTANSVSFTAVTASLNVPGVGSSKRVAFRNTNGNIDFVQTGSIAGDLLQWDGTDFVMSNVIDGGSF